MSCERARTYCAELCCTSSRDDSPCSRCHKRFNPWLLTCLSCLVPGLYHVSARTQTDMVHTCRSTHPMLWLDGMDHDELHDPGGASSPSRCWCCVQYIDITDSWIPAPPLCGSISLPGPSVCTTRCRSTQITKGRWMRAKPQAVV